MRSSEEDFKGFIRPGALHKARWMAKIIYCIKMVLISSSINELPKGSVFAAGQLLKISKFVKFVVHVYVPWWLTTPVFSATPMHNLNLIESIRKYGNAVGNISQSALKAFIRHLWYITKELVPLVLPQHIRK